MGKSGAISNNPFWRGHKVKLLMLLCLGLLWWFCLPKTLFTSNYATVVESKEGALLGARIAEDGQWRFPPIDTVPHKFESCIRYFEDEYFYQHPGFNPIAISKALWHNMTTKGRRGGSTLTQQLIRLSRQQKKRTYGEKLIELFMATRLEVRLSKKEILAHYASHAPFGGNVVGLDAASWRYFGIPPGQLSWGQTAALAVLPNAPSLIFPGTKDELLLKKRNGLLKKLLLKKAIDSTDYELALAEPLPKKPLALPTIAPHLVEHLKQKKPNTRWHTSINYSVQEQANRLVHHHFLSLKANQIHNLALLVLDLETNQVVAYVGNAPAAEAHDPYVDIVQRKRSTGSILKPLLFAAALDDGLVLPRTLIKDIPTVINGYQPENFDGGFDGVVPTNIALSRSLNIPAVRLLRRYGLSKFHRQLPKLGIPLKQNADHYGLSLILGGAEATLWEMTNAYAGLAKTLNFFNQSSSEYALNSFKQATFLNNNQTNYKKQQETPVIGAGAIYKVFESLQQVNRPRGQENWHFFNESKPIAWKTGTSFGFKDAWAIGVTPKYAIGVWAGNADGEGRPGLTGIEAAAPLLFKVLETLPATTWFAPPYDSLTEINTCTQSGHMATPHCTTTTKEWVPHRGLQTPPCPYHSTLSLNAEESHQVTADCYPLAQIKVKSWFGLPAVLAHYYSLKHPAYKDPPPFLDSCTNAETAVMQFIFPTHKETILLPKGLDGRLGEVVFKLAHQQAENTVFWYLDDAFMGSSQQFHEIALTPKPGTYRLSATDEKGNRVVQQITIRLAND